MISTVLGFDLSAFHGPVGKSQVRPHVVVRDPDRKPKNTVRSLVGFANEKLLVVPLHDLLLWIHRIIKGSDKHVRLGSVLVLPLSDETFLGRNFAFFPTPVCITLVVVVLLHGQEVHVRDLMALSMIHPMEAATADAVEGAPVES